MARFRNRTHSIIPLFAGLVVGSLVLGWLGIPMVSSEGMIVRSHLVAGELPSVPEDPAWDKIPVMAIPLSGQVITRPVWPEPSARSLGLRSIHNGAEIAFQRRRAVFRRRTEALDCVGDVDKLVPLKSCTRVCGRIISRAQRVPAQ